MICSWCARRARAFRCLCASNVRLLLDRYFALSIVSPSVLRWGQRLVALFSARKSAYGVSNSGERPKIVKLAACNTLAIAAREGKLGKNCAINSRFRR